MITGAVPESRGTRNGSSGSSMGWKTEGHAGPVVEVDDPLLSVLHPYVPKGFDAIVAAREGDRNAVRSGLLEAELRGEVRAWPGDQFTRTVR